jgi:hypothetical protein
MKQKIRILNKIIAGMPGEFPFCFRLLFRDLNVDKEWEK